MKLIYTPFFALLATGLAIFLCFSLYTTSRTMSRSGASINLLEDEVSKENADVSRLQKTLDQAKKPATKEAIIRDQLLMQRPGEYVVQLPDVVVPDVGGSAESESALISSNNNENTPLEHWKELLLK